MSTYTGIDYGMGKANINTETGIRYGVISQNSISGESLNGITTGPDSMDLGFEQYKNDIKSAIKNAVSEFMHDREAERFAEHAVDDYDSLGDSYQSDELDFEYDTDEYCIRKCLDNNLFVIRSPYYTHAQFCSPCVPGAGNLDSPVEDGPKTYCLGHDFFEDGAPYLVFSVKTNEQITKP